MAKFGASGRKESRRAWKQDVLVKRLCAALDIYPGYGLLKVEHTPYENHHAYLVRWSFNLGYTGVAGENELRLQENAERILAVFTEMEEKVKTVKAFEDPLDWLLEGDGDDEDDALLAAYLHGCAEGQGQ